MRCWHRISRALWLLALVAVAAPASAQPADEHAAHHGGASSASSSAAASDSMGAAAPGDGSGMGAMMGEMMGEGEHHGPRQRPLLTQLLALPSLDAAGRADLVRQADDRIHRGAALISEGTAFDRHAALPAERIEAARKVREGAALFESGALAKGALAGVNPPAEVATDWFRSQLSIPAPQEAASVGFSPSHLLLMLFLVLVSGSLIGLQLLRWQRIRKIVASSATVAGAARTPAPPPQPREASPAAEADSLAPSNSASAGGAALRQPRRWTGSLRVVQIVRETPSVQTFRLADPASDRLPFDFLPGQFLQVEVEPEQGNPARRSYTIASSPTQRAYVELTVKREQQGIVSRYLHDRLAVGDLVKISGPFGAFTFTGSDADSIVLIAGGVGITPMMSVLRYLTDTAWPGEIFFLYGARSTEEFVFREEIERIERRHANLHVLAVMQRAPGTTWFGAEGTITGEMLAAAVPDIAKRRIHLCGPPPMMAAIKAELVELGVSEAQLHTEAFGPASLPVDHIEPPAGAEAVPDGAKAPPKPAAATDAAATTITFSVSGVSAPLRTDETVLEAAEDAGVEIPYSCRVGECGVCVTKLLKGNVTMAVEKGLAASDKAAGYVLACQAKSTGDPLVVEA